MRSSPNSMSRRKSRHRNEVVRVVEERAFVLIVGIVFVLLVVILGMPDSEDMDPPPFWQFAKHFLLRRAHITKSKTTWESEKNNWGLGG